MGCDNSRVSYIRAGFWIIGLSIGCLTAYTGRFFQNNDAMVYIEIGEALWTGRWWDATNFTFSPIYGLMVRMFQAVMQANPETEIISLKALNVLVLAVSMLSFEFFLSVVRRSWEEMNLPGDKPLDWCSISAICYSVFLVAALVSVRTRLINPDMLVMAISFVCMSIIISISWGNLNYSRFVALGAAIGAGYLTKAFFFLYSPALILVAGLSCNSARKAFPRCVIASVVALTISAPLLIGLSMKKGSFSYGEGGRHVYAILFGAKGDPVFPGLVLNDSPRTVEYQYGGKVTRPLTFDVTYWTIGVQPELDIKSLLVLFSRNLAEVFAQSPWVFFIMAWYLLNIRIGSVKLTPVMPPMSPQLVLMFLGVLGVALFALVAMEPRYVAPFVCCFSAGLCLSVRTLPVYGWKRRMISWSPYGLASVLIFFVLDSAIDQSYRGLVSTPKKASYKESFEENVAVRETLSNNNILPGDKIAVIGSPPFQWARMGGLRITGEILYQAEFLRGDSVQRSMAIESLRRAEYRAVIAIGQEYERLQPEGWSKILGTRDFHVYLF